MPLSRPDAAGIQVYISNQLVSGFTSSASGSPVTIVAPGADPVGATRAAINTWNNSGANIKFLPVQTTSAPLDHSDGKMTIALAVTQQDISFVGHAIAITDSQYFTGSGVYNGLNVVNGSIFDSDIMLNPTMTFSTDGTGSAAFVPAGTVGSTQDFQTVITHELCHALGANHTGLLSSTMFQAPIINGRFISADELAFVNSAYPPVGVPQLGTISGTITISGGAPASYGLVTMIDTGQNLSYSALTNTDGTYSMQLPPGDYVVYCEPATGIVKASNFYLSTSQANQASTFETTFNGDASATSHVSAGNTTVVSFSVNAGSATFIPPYIGFGTPGQKADVSTYSKISGPIAVASGQTVDLVFGGPGLDGTLTTSNIAVLGGGVSVQGITNDTRLLNLVGNPPYTLQRLTLQIPATQTPTTASIVITKGNTVLSLSGVLAITPQIPSFSTNSLVNAAAFSLATGGAGASPGELATLFGSFLGPTNPVGNGGFDASGYLATNLAGVTVTFDGVPAPLIAVSSGQVTMQVPYEIAGKSSTTVAVNYYGAVGTTAPIKVLPVQPAFFTLNFDGKDDSVVINQDGSVNSPTVSVNPPTGPAKQNSYVVFYGTGIGVTTLGAAGYGLQTGVGAPGLHAPTSNYDPAQAYTCTLSNAAGSITLNAAFGGWTPGYVGLAQWNLQLATSLTGTVSVYCTDTSSGVRTQTGTIFIH